MTKTPRLRCASSNTTAQVVVCNDPGLHSYGHPQRRFTYRVSAQCKPRPVRDALRKLERVGLVISELNRGTYVARLKLDDLEEIYSLCIVQEQLEMRLACRNPDDTANSSTSLSEEMRTRQQN